jgi:ABC-2 type transport system permease protein
MLVTAPVRDFEVVLAKFTGVFLFYSAMVALTGTHVVSMLLYSEGPVDWGRFGTGYLGMLLIAAYFLSFGLFVSSLFESPVLAALVAFAAGLAMLMAGLIASSPVFLQGGIGKDLFLFLLPFKHYQTFQTGIVDTRDLAYFIIFIAYFLFLATRSMEGRKWK